MPVRSARDVRVWVLLALVVALSFGLRFGAITRLLPIQPEPDAYMVGVLRQQVGETTPFPGRYDDVYPHLLPILTAHVFGPEALARAPLDSSLAEHLRAASAPYLLLRYTVAAFAFLLAPLLFLVARRWLEGGSAALAAALLATALLHLAHSAVAKPHAAGATLTWLAILCALRQLERPTWVRMLLTAGAAGLAIGTIQSGYFTLPVLFAAAFLGWRRTPGRWLAIGAWILPCLVVLTGILSSTGGLHVQEGGVRMGSRGHLLRFQSLSGSGLVRWLELFWQHDPLLAVLAAVGLPLALLQAWRARSEPIARGRWLLLASFVLPYALLVSLDRRVVDRYLLPLYPVFCLLAAMALDALQARLPRRVPRSLLVTLALALPTWTAVRYTWLGTRPSTFDRLATWLEARPGARDAKILLTPNFSPPLFPTQGALHAQLATTAGRAQPWFHYLGQLEHVPATAPAYDLRPLRQRLLQSRPLHGEPDLTEQAAAAYLEAEAPDLIVLEIREGLDWVPGWDGLYRAIRARAELLTVISGEGGRMPGESWLDYQDPRHLARRVLRAESFGPHIEVYGWRAP